MPHMLYTHFKDIVACRCYTYICDKLLILCFCLLKSFCFGKERVICSFDIKLDGVMQTSGVGSYLY